MLWSQWLSFFKGLLSAEEILAVRNDLLCGLTWEYVYAYWQRLLLNLSNRRPALLQHEKRIC